MQRKWIYFSFILSVLVTIAIALMEVGQAVPIFARKYGTACTTCHVLIPKLNAFGIAFRNNGYRIPKNNEKFVKTNDVSLGAPAWKKVWPKAVWPGAIPGAPPFALRILTDTKVVPSAPVKVDWDMPHELEFYFAGTSGDSLSFFGELEFKGDDTISLERAYMQFHSLFDTPLANLRFGRIDVRADPFSRSFRRLTSEHFNVSDLSPVSGQPRLRHRQAGIEWWGASTGPDDRGGLEYGFGLVNGVEKKRDNNNFKDYYWTASYKLGGMGVTGSSREPDSLEISDNYSEYSLLIGGFGYVGRSANPLKGFDEDRYRRTGVKFDAFIDKLNLYGAAVWGKDELRGLSRRQIDTTAFFVEADYVLSPFFVPLLRFEKSNFSDRRNMVRFVPAVNFAIRANCRLLVEGRLYNKLSEGSNKRTGTNEARIRLDFVF